ncbi:hypothetical protein LMTR13_02730 [Bradyrhizobium icense]|uniref:Autotransporter outer membrane beta-barrel domain-containing protein n=1 Tax=Bradyrhizobium icense TaxID=1274631 RepID=A0A1B1U915_9BRAD|nr:hypothetical protein LMTR13_02730 [Bradyrhizobium icense]
MGTAMPRAGARTSVGERTMVGARYCHVGLRGVGCRLSGSAALAHDFNPGCRIEWRNAFAVGAAFEGQFSNVTRSYVGKGVVRHVW